MAKRLKLCELSGLKRVNDSALSAVLKVLQNQGALDPGFATGTTTIRQSVLEEIQDGEFTAHGGVLHSIWLPKQSGGYYEWVIPNFAGLLNYFTSTVEEFSDTLWSTKMER